MFPFQFEMVPDNRSKGLRRRFSGTAVIQFIKAPATVDMRAASYQYLHARKSLTARFGLMGQLRRFAQFVGRAVAFLLSEMAVLEERLL
jgi:hypothetical protein